MLDVVGDQPCTNASELCGAWGKIRHTIVLIFFDLGVHVNFITSALVDKLGICLEHSCSEFLKRQYGNGREMVETEFRSQPETPNREI